MGAEAVGETIAYLGLLDDEQIELDVAALQLSALDHPGVDLKPYLEALDGYEAELRAAAGEARSAIDQARALARLLAGHHGFTGDSASYDAPLNADMIRVMDRRRGLPVSLSILYVALARRIGWSTDALNTPGHVLVRVGPGEAAVLIDPFHGGMPVTERSLLDLLRRSLGEHAEIDGRHLLPMDNRMVLARLLLNQASRAELGNDPARAMALYGRMVEIAPSNGQGWWDLARLQLGAGRVEEARGSLSAMLEVTRDADMRAHISTALEALAGR